MIEQQQIAQNKTEQATEGPEHILFYVLLLLTALNQPAVCRHEAVWEEPTTTSLGLSVGSIAQDLFSSSRRARSQTVGSESKGCM